MFAVAVRPQNLPRLAVAHLLGRARGWQGQMLWPHTDAGQQPEGLGAVNQQQLLVLDGGVQALGCPHHRQDPWAVRQQHAAAVAHNLLQSAPEELPIQLLQLQQLLALEPAVWQHKRRCIVART